MQASDKFVVGRCYYQASLTRFHDGLQPTVETVVYQGIVDGSNVANTCRALKQLRHFKYVDSGEGFFSPLGEHLEESLLTWPEFLEFIKEVDKEYNECLTHNVSQCSCCGNHFADGKQLILGPGNSAICHSCIDLGISAFETRQGVDMSAGPCLCAFCERQFELFQNLICANCIEIARTVANIGRQLKQLPAKSGIKRTGESKTGRLS